MSNSAAEIKDWHAHVYFDAATRDVAADVYAQVEAALKGIELGRFHERPVGPHPMWSFQVAFAPEMLDTVFPWLVLNRQGLDVFMHPNTGNALEDHTDRVSFIGKSYELDTAKL